MRVDASAWARPGDGSVRLRCPGCGAGLPTEALAAGQRLARCRQCGQLVRRVVPRSWPAALRETLAGDRNYTALDDTGEIQLEVASNYPYPALSCPYCEHINHDQPSARADGQQFCANCGADLKKPCLNCDAPMYILDYFCTRCRSDQERVKYEVEGLYWQHYNEGKRLARLGQWEDVERELGLFFNPSNILDREHVRRARQIYVSSIAPFDAGEGLQIYNEAISHLREAGEVQRRRLERRKLERWAWWGGAVATLALASWLIFGSWWAIFVIVPAVGLLLALLVLFIMIHLGLF